MKLQTKWVYRQNTFRFLSLQEVAVVVIGQLGPVYQSMNDAEYQMLHPPTATRLSTMDNFLSLSDSWQMIRVFFNESPAIILVHAVVCKNS
jgi:hypothetical protein